MEQCQLLFLLIIPAIWVGISYVSFKAGWKALIELYSAGPGLITEKAGMVSGTVRQATYTNSLVVRYNNDGLYLRPIRLFSLFHKPAFIPWKDIREGNHISSLVGQRKVLEIGNPVISKLILKQEQFEKLESYLGLYRKSR